MLAFVYSAKTCQIQLGSKMEPLGEPDANGRVWSVMLQVRVLCRYDAASLSTHLRSSFQPQMAISFKGMLPARWCSSFSLMLTKILWQLEVKLLSIS